MKEKIRIGFVGCGQFARHFVPLFKAHPACEYVALCDKFRDRAEKFMEKFGADKIFDTYEEMLASDEVNAIADTVQSSASNIDISLPVFFIILSSFTFLG